MLIFSQCCQIWQCLAIGLTGIASSTLPFILFSFSRSIWTIFLDCNAMAVGAGLSILQLTPGACQGFHKRVSLCQFWKQRRTIWQIWWTKVYGKAAKTIQCIFFVSNDSKGNQKLESESERGSWNVEQNAGFTCDRLGNRPEQPNLPNLLPSVSIQIGIHCRKSSGKIETRTKLSCWEIFYTKYFGHVLKCSVRFKKHFRGYGAYCRITNCMSWFPNKPI